MKKHLNVLLVSPLPYPSNGSDQKLNSHRLYPYSVVYLVNYLKRNNICEADYLDLVMNDEPELARRVQEEHFDLIGFTSTTSSRFDTIDLIKRVRGISPESQIVVGGNFFTATGVDALKHVPEIDFVVYGEGEITLAELVQGIAAETREFAHVNGLIYRSNGNIVKNPPRPEEKDVDKFKIDFDLIKKPGYDMLFPMLNFPDRDDMRAFPIMAGRGCNQQCIFCQYRLMKFRVRKIDSIMEDIDWAIRNLNARYFMFADPSFTERVTFVEQFCNHLIDNNYNIKWYCEARADMSLDLLRLMNRAGCISLDFALESGSDKVLQTLRKRVKMSEIDTFAKECHQLGVHASVFTMVSLPDEKPEDLEKTFDILKKLFEYGFHSQPQPLNIFPGTPLEQIAIERGVLPRDFSWYDRDYQCHLKFILDRENKVPHYLEGLTEEQVTRFIERCNKTAVEMELKKQGVSQLMAKGLKKVFQIRSFSELSELAKKAAVAIKVRVA